MSVLDHQPVLLRGVEASIHPCVCASYTNPLYDTATGPVPGSAAGAGGVPHLLADRESPQGLCIHPPAAGVFMLHQAPYRSGPIAREKKKMEIDHMLRGGVIELTSAEWASPVVFVPKKDGTMRFCVDYRELNAVTVCDFYPLPRMDEYIDSLGDATVFTTLDCNSGY